MAIAQVFRRAGILHVDVRWNAWDACGTHDLANLPTTEPAGERHSVRYCPGRWTLFGVSGQPLNPPLHPRHHAKRAYRLFWRRH